MSVVPPMRKARKGGWFQPSGASRVHDGKSSIEEIGEAVELSPKKMPLSRSPLLDSVSRYEKGRLVADI